LATSGMIETVKLLAACSSTRMKSAVVQSCAHSLFST
jgi:hypothetical protein